MKTINKAQQGFTLVELIIVIVILGILAVTAAPRFLNFSGDAREAVLDGASGAIKAGNALVYGKASIAGLTGAALSCYVTASQSVVAATGTTPACAAGQVDLVYGYLAADKDSLKAGIELNDFFLADSTDGSAYTIVVAADTVRLAGSSAELNPAAPANACYLTYAQATSSAEPTVTVSPTGCN